MTMILGEIEVDRERLAASFTPELFAADEALEMAAKGIPFRTAYKEVGLNLDKLKDRDPRKNILSKKHLGAPGNLGLDGLRARAGEERDALGAEAARLDDVRDRLLAL
jgi:argininosuccinate lyase